MCKRSRDAGQWLSSVVANAWAVAGSSVGFLHSLPFSLVDGFVNHFQILVLNWYQFMNLLRVNLFCNFY